MNISQTSFKRILAATAVAAAALAPLAGAQAQYPDRPINLVVSYGPGGGTDLVARAIAPYISKYLGNDARIVVLNRPGAGGAIGFTEIKRAAPDGYTIGFLNTPNLVTIPIERQTNYHWTDFTLLGNLIDDPDSFAVRNDSPLTSLDAVAKYARANPGKITVGTTGVGSDDHLAMLQFQKAQGVEMTHVAYKGAGEVRTAVQSGEIMMAAMNIGEIKAYVSGGAPLRDLGVMSVARTDLAPDSPTFREQGYDIIMASLRGIGAPKGLPDDVAAKLADAIRQAAHDPEFVAKAKQLSAPLRYLDPVAYATELRDTEALFKAFWNETPWAEK